MARGWWFAAVVALAPACGRIGFDAGGIDPTGDGGNTSGDTMFGDGAAGACPAFALMCDDFESGALTKWTRLEQVGLGTSGLQTNTTRSGTFAFAGNKMPSGNSGAQALVLDLTPQTTGVISVRQWIYAMDPIEDFDLVASVKNADDQNYTAVGGDAAGLWVVSEMRNGGATVDTSTSIATVGPSTWTCVELVFTFGSPPQVQVFVNDTMIVTMPGDTPSPTYDAVTVGAVRGDQLGFHVLVDDVVIAHQRIGC